MPETAPQGNAPEVGIGLLGYVFMGKAHSNAYKKIPYMMYPPSVIPRLAAICGLEADVAADAAHRYGYAASYTDYEAMLKDPGVQILDNSGPNFIHAPASIAAAHAGKHVFCEKPLGLNAEEAQAMLAAVQKAGVKHMVGFNYRFVPAVRLAYDLMRSGRLGKIYHFRARYLQDWLTPPYNTPWHWRVNKAQTGSGTIGDLGAHIIDLSRFLLGAEIESVCAMTRTFISERPMETGSGTGRVDVDDTFAAAVSFSNGALGTLEASRFATGHKNDNTYEINAENGSLRFSLERINELEVMWVDADTADETSRLTQGFRQVLVTDKDHPYISNWWPAGHVIGWEHTFVHELAHFLDCVANDRPVAPYGATFEDGLRVAQVCDAIAASARSKKQTDL